MKLSENRQEVFCHLHHEGRGAWISIRAETYNVDNNILCLLDDTHLGFAWDLPEIFDKEKGDSS